jgi:proteasome lid subunit RPN8/RPN11
MVVIARHCEPQIAVWAEQAYPHEAVGLLVGRRVGDDWEVHRLVPAANLATTPDTQFVLDPMAWFDAERIAVQAGMSIVGIIHSHPDAPARPSVHDSASGDSLGRGFVFFIITITKNGMRDLTAWQWDGREYQEIIVQWN